tara:strand:+ start:476 stop:589 length:114 start_codon:yes stop_codon:yes gene_type:complete
VELEEVTLELLLDQADLAAEEPAEEAEMEQDKLEPMD